MARPLRVEVPDGIYHVTARGNERRPIYRDVADRQRFLEVLKETLERFYWRCLSYCLMSNHYHLLVRTLEANLARGMRDLNGVYAQAFNRRHGRDGHLFQGRYRATLIDSDEHLLTVVAYIVRNPVRASMCERPGAWPWSSHAATLGDYPPGLLALAELLSHFGADWTSARARYRELAEDGTDEVVVDRDRVVMGSDDFVRRHLRGSSARPRSRPRTSVRPDRHWA